MCTYTYMYTPFHSEMLGGTVGRAWVIWGWIQCMDYSGYMQISENNSIMLEKQRMLYTFASTATDQTSEPGRKDKQSIPCRTLYHHGHWEPQEGCYPAKEKEGELLDPSSQDHANPARHALMREGPDGWTATVLGVIRMCIVVMASQAWVHFQC